MSNDDTIVWDKDYWLTWDDFRGTPDYKNPRTAESVVGIRCKYQTELIKTKTKSKFMFKNTNPQAEFFRTKSWVKPEMISGDEISRKLLKHEQVHFDAAHELVQKVYSRKLAELVGKKYTTKGKTTQEIEVNRKKETERIIMKIVDDANRELIKFHEKYDEETKHGVVSQIQERYNARFVTLRS